MDESMVDRYWCHMCSQTVNPIMDVELQCPRCDSGFVEEVDGRGDVAAAAAADDDDDDVGSDQALSLWAPILLGILRGGSPRRRRIHREEGRENSDRDRALEAIMRRRRRSSAMLQLLQGLRRSNQAESDSHREHVVLINPYNQAIILQGSSDTNQSMNSSSNGILLGDYFVGSGLDLLIQRLADNDPNRYGTPPALKEAVDAMPTVRIEKKSMSCSVCLEDFEVGGEASEMPCQHKFHGSCILPWLEFHSSCPVCRFQLPTDESKAPNAGGGGGESVPWPLSGLFSWSSGSQSSSSNSNSQLNEN